MDNLQSELQNIYDETAATLSQSAEDNAAEPAVETSVDEALDEAVVEQEAEETQEAEEESLEADETETSTDTSSDAGFQDLLESVPSEQSLQGFYKEHRIPNAAKPAIEQWINQWQADKALTDKVGGEDGVKVVEPLMTLMAKPAESITVDDVLASSANLIKTNGPAYMALLENGTYNLLLNTVPNDPLFKAARDKGDLILEARFGKGYTSQAIEELVRLEEAGFIDRKADLDLLNSSGTGSQLFEKQQETISTQEKELQELRNLVENPHLIEARNKESANAVGELATELETRIMESIKPLQERFKWDTLPGLSKDAVDSIVAKLEKSDEYKAAKDFVRQYGHFKAADGTLPWNINVKLTTLVNMAKAQFGERVMKHNDELRNRAATGRNAQREKEVQKETKAKAAQTAPASNGNSYPIDKGTLERELDKVYQANGDIWR